MTEEESRQRQRARFERLAHVVVEPLHRYLLRRTSADMVDDILAEAMLVLWRRIDDVPGLGSAPASCPTPMTCCRGATGWRVAAWRMPGVPTGAGSGWWSG